MTRTTPEMAPPSPNFRSTPTGGRLATTYDLACNRPDTRRIFSGIGFQTCDPPVETLPLGHRGLLNSYSDEHVKMLMMGQMSYSNLILESNMHLTGSAVVPEPPYRGKFLYGVFK
ncbi:hypothetical protein AVEN_24358-1 [Araneus ventricosus]|uniref:Uncharacterized protein n=1 Tax=Araneus ventricosus TaxID=182803 RepID=A0A4Y2HUK2_ARAVE|nr:hypothetical protein AVEN_24358-1 [Araneus ventricosus]